MRTCVTGFHVSVLAQVVCLRWQTIEESGAEPLKYCCLTTAAARLHQLTAALRLHDADKREECNIKGQHAIWQSAPLLRSTERSHETQRGFPSKTRLLGFFFFFFGEILNYLCTFQPKKNFLKARDCWQHCVFSFFCPMLYLKGIFL